MICSSGAVFLLLENGHLRGVRFNVGKVLNESKDWEASAVSLGVIDLPLERMQAARKYFRTFSFQKPNAEALPFLRSQHLGPLVRP